MNARALAFAVAFPLLAVACASMPEADDSGNSPFPEVDASIGGDTTGSDDAGNGGDPHRGGGDGASPVDSGAPPPRDGATLFDAGLGYDAAEFNTPPVCTSGVTWTGGNTKSVNMQPGSACRTCHVVGGQASGKSMDIAGTVYPTGHEPDDCNGIGGANVIITDVNGTEHSLAVNAVGNFYNMDLFGIAAIPKPYTARVEAGGRTRAMLSAETDGTCNSCHTEQGASGAPGRIKLP
jgi:hypothetical protein